MEEAICSLEISQLPKLNGARQGACQAAKALYAAVSQLNQRKNHLREKICGIALEIAQHLSNVIDHTKVLIAVDSGQLKQNISDLTTMVQHACEVLLDLAMNETPGEIGMVRELIQHLDIVVDTLVNESCEAAASMDPDMSTRVLNSSQRITALVVDISKFPNNAEPLRALADEVASLFMAIATVLVTSEYIQKKKKKRKNLGSLTHINQFWIALTSVVGFVQYSSRHCRIHSTAR